MKNETNDAITTFRGGCNFLSNFYPVQIWMSTNLYPSVEHAFQAAKTLDSGERVMIQEARTAAEAKHLGSKVKMQPCWEDIKLNTMRSLLFNKFSIRNSALLEKLLATDGRKLVEENDWGDIYWGRCGGVGQNWLGRLLMQVREKRAGERREA